MVAPGCVHGLGGRAHGGMVIARWDGAHGAVGKRLVSSVVFAVFLLWRAWVGVEVAAAMNPTPITRSLRINFDYTSNPSVQAPSS